MIFVTLGSQKFQFNRLLEAIDRLVEKGAITDHVFAQIGCSDYKPEHYEYKDFLNRDEFAEYMQKASLVITHGGTGAIIGALKQDKIVIAVPRLAKYGEHVDDHQLQLVSQFKELNLICDCQDMDELETVIKKATTAEFGKYQSNTNAYIEAISEYIDNL